MFFQSGLSPKSPRTPRKPRWTKTDSGILVVSFGTNLAQRGSPAPLDLRAILFTAHMPSHMGGKVVSPMIRKTLAFVALAWAVALAVTPADGAIETPEEVDQRLGPWLDLRGGGVAVGRPQGVLVTQPDGSTTGSYGSLANARPLPRRGEGFRSVSAEDESFGAGHMISLIENSAAYIHQIYPDVELRVGDISKVDGGYFYPPHKSHQNGLDVDLLYVGETRWRSVLDGENVSARFSFQKNWDYWNAIVSQKLRDQGRDESVVSMILVDPRIKTAVCEWAAQQGLDKTADGIEVLRRLRPTAGHDDHFHIRLRCSPYHSQCEGNFSPPGATGC